MDIDVLRYVVTLADELHFGRAAAQHFVAAGHFGRRIARLERELGVQLFARTSRRVAVTPEGMRLVAHARAVLGAVDALTRVSERPDRSSPSVLCVGVLGFGVAHRWPALRDVVAATAPGTVLVHTELDLADQYDVLLRGESDVALVHYLGEVDGLHLQPVLDTGCVAVVPVASPWADADRLSRKDVADASWIQLSGAHPRLADWAGPAQQAPRTAPVVRNPAAIAAAVATSGLLGLHGAAAGQFYARPDVRYVPLDGEPVTVAVATRRGDDRPAVEAFRRAARAVADPQHA